MKVEKTGKYLEVSFKFDPELVAGIKEITGRTYNPATRTWRVPDTPISRRKLRQLGFELPPEDSPVSIPKLPDYLMPFQREGVEFIFRRNGRALIADEMGLGKTVQAVTYTNLAKAFPVLVICPASLKWNWYNEIKKWTGKESVVISGSKIGTLKKADYYIINYDILVKWLPVLSAIKPEAIILDECHYIKNNKAKRTRAVKTIAKKTKKVIALTGTPIENRPIEIFNTLNILAPSVFRSRWKFAERYCDLRHNGFGWVADGSSNEEELHELLTGTVMIRRKKEDVLKDLPQKLRTVLPVDFSSREYYKLLRKLRNSVYVTGDMVEYDRGSVLGDLAKMRRLIGEGKIPAAIEWIENFFEDNPTKKLVVFGWHKEVMKQVYNHFSSKAVLLTGDTSEKDRAEAVERFQNDAAVKLFVGSIKAAGVGITLTAADTALFIELAWTPSELEQAEDRIHRIGQENSVGIYYLIARNSIDEHMMEIIDRKREIISQIIDGKEVSANTILNELLRKVAASEI